MIGRYFKDCFGKRVLVVGIRHNSKKNVSRVTYQTDDGRQFTVGLEDENSFEGWSAWTGADEYYSVRAKVIPEGWTWYERAPWLPAPTEAGAGVRG